jgi:hypothetical protein
MLRLALVGDVAIRFFYLFLLSFSWNHVYPYINIMWKELSSFTLLFWMHLHSNYKVIKKTFMDQLKI